MKCKICGEKTTYEDSYGRDTFIVCSSCHKKLSKEIKRLRKYKFSPETSALEIILTIGYLMEERKKK